MDHFEALRLFTRVVELGSFTRAAGALEIPRAAATHAIKELEARLGARLLERKTRVVRPTLGGEAFYERCPHLLAELEEAESALKNVAVNPRGRLRLDLHGVHATRIILPRIQEFRERYPQIKLLISRGDRLVNLVREGIDCVVRRLASMSQVLCASLFIYASTACRSIPMN